MPNNEREGRLENCPFCDAQAKVISVSKHEWFVSCSGLSCGAQLPGQQEVYFTSKEIAIERWNYRHSTPKQELVELDEETLDNVLTEHGFDVEERENLCRIIINNFGTKRVPSVEMIWELLQDNKGCKKTGEDCNFKMCSRWAECENLARAIKTLIEDTNLLND